MLAEHGGASNVCYYPEKFIVSGVRSMFMRGAVLAWMCLLLLWPASSRGQTSVGDVEEPDATAEEVADEVIVTGSRVRRSNLDSPSPVLVFNASNLVDNGITTMSEFARYLPQNADNFSDSSSGNTNLKGAAAFNLRGIGLDGTLTLINGRRIAPFGASGDTEPFVDINAIPIAAIERIEVLKDGASAIYGSEAVAGVVNIILKKSMEGFVAEAGYLTATKGDGAEQDASVAGGWANESTQVLGTLSWFNRDLIWSRDRAWSSDIDLRKVGGVNQRSSFGSPGTMDLLQSHLRRADPACPEDGPINSRIRQSGPGGRYRESCLFNYAAFTTLQQPSERWSATASMDHEFSSGLTTFAELIYNRSDTSSILAPTPLPFYFVPAYHPNNPFGEDLLIRYRMLDAGDRGFEGTTTTWRAVAGLRGALGEWEWEGALNRSESQSEDSRVNGVLSARFQDALLGLGGPEGDQFYNPFGLNPSNPQEVVDQILISGTRTILTNIETDADLQVSGKFGKLPGGAVGAAFGLQWRQQKLDQYADEEELSGVIEGGGGILPLIDDRRINSVFAEFVLPVLPSLEAQLAVRYDDYSDFGSTTNPKIGLGWRPMEDILLRATWGTSFRPPTFRELFDPVYEYIGFVSTDPWRCPVTEAFEDCEGHEVNTRNVGNPELQPDQGETRLLGVAWEPHSAPGLSFALDLWAIDHQNRVIAVSTDAVFDFFLQNLPPDENPYVTRAPPSEEDIALHIPGPITGLVYTYVNAGKVTTQGIDVEAKYGWSTGQAGDFNLGLNYTYLEEYSIGISDSGAELKEDWAGGYGERGALPHNRGNLTFHWERNAHALTALYHYVGSYKSPLNLSINNIETDRPFKVDAYTQFDLQYSYTFQSLRGATLRLGCQNCTDEDPPVYNYTVNAEAFHEGRGALVYVRWTQPF